MEKGGVMAAAKPVLITAFKPWKGRPTNITQDIVTELEDDLRSMSVDTTILDVSYEAVDEFTRNLDVTTYSNIISLGIMRQNRPPIRFETRARKLSVKPDDFGLHPVFNNSAADIYPVSDALLGIKQNLRLYPYDMGISDNAGGYVCEYTLFRMLEKTAHSNTGAAFIHFSNEDKAEKKALLLDYLNVLACY